MAINAKVDEHQHVSLEIMSCMVCELHLNHTAVKTKIPKQKQGKVGLVFEKNVEKDLGWWIGFYTSRDNNNKHNLTATAISVGSSFEYFL